MITIKEVSELAQVSQATVSRAINGHPTVKEANRKKVFEAIAELGYKPNAFAQALASNRSNSIGMLVGSLDGSFFGPLMHAAESVARKDNMHLIVTSGQESRKNELDSVSFLQSKQVDGLLLTSDKLTDDELIEASKHTEATIILNRYIPEMAARCIYVDNELGGYIATKYLLEQGHTSIGCLTGQLSKIDSRERLQGYRNALMEFNISYDAKLVVEARFDHHGNHDAARRLLSRAPEMSAIFCQNDNIALAVYDIAAELQRTIGDNLSIVGFDNDNLSQHIRPRLTTVNIPNHEMGAEAAKAVLALIKKQDYPLKGRVIPEIVIRDSVAKKI